MKPISITIAELKYMQETTLLPDAFVMAYNVIFDSGVQHVSQIQLNEAVVAKINEIFNKWLLFVCNTCVLHELVNAGILPKDTIKQTIHKNFLVNDINDKSDIAQQIRIRLLKYELRDFYTIFWMALGEWEADRTDFIKDSYKRNKRVRRPHANVIFAIPKRQEPTMKRAFKNMVGISAEDAMASAIFLLLKEQLNAVDIQTKQELSFEINKIKERLSTYKRCQSAAKKSHKIQKTIRIN